MQTTSLGTFSAEGQDLIGDDGDQPCRIGRLDKGYAQKLAAHLNWGAELPGLQKCIWNIARELPVTGKDEAVKCLASLPVPSEGLFFPSFAETAFEAEGFSVLKVLKGHLRAEMIVTESLSMAEELTALLNQGLAYPRYYKILETYGKSARALWEVGARLG